MAEIQNDSSLQALVESWIKAEQEGENFPVPFALAWQIAGYSKKSNAKRKLLKLSQGADLLRSEQMVDRPQGGGAKEEVFHMTCDAFKHFCLMAETEQGRNIRQYFIECEKKWQLLKQHRPEVAEEIELLKLKAEIAKNEAIKAKAEEQVISLRHYVATALPETLQQKVLGYAEVKVVEYRDRIIKDEEVIRDGSTIQKTEMCQRLGFLTRTGKPDFKRLNNLLENAGLPSEAFQLKASIRENLELKRECWPLVEEFWKNCDRQQWLGE